MIISVLSKELDTDLKNNVKKAHFFILKFAICENSLKFVTKINIKHNTTHLSYVLVSNTIDKENGK